MAASLSPTAAALAASRPLAPRPSRPAARRRAAHALATSTRCAVEGLESRTLFAATGINSNGVLPNGVDPDHLGKGDWIQSVALADNAKGFTSPAQLFAFEASLGVQWVAVKAADGNQLLTQYNQQLVDQAHAAGLKIFAYGHVYGGFQNFSTVPGEIAAADSALSLGSDGYIFDAEGEWENLGLATGATNAQREANSVRSAFPNTFLAYTTFAQPSQHPNFSFQAWSANTDAVMPQAYWQQLGLTPAAMASTIDSEFNSLYTAFVNAGDAAAVKPVVPVGQGFGPVTGADITSFVDTLKASPIYPYDNVLGNPLGAYGGYAGVSFFSAQDHSADVFNAIAAESIGLPAAPANPSPADNARLNASPILLQWDPTPRATSYDVYRDGAFLGNFAIPKVGITSPLADGVHLFQVTARNAVGATTGPVWAFVVDTHAPTVQSVNAPNLTTLGVSSYTFSVTFSDNIALNASTIASTSAGGVSSVIDVVDSSGTVHPVRLVSVDSTADTTAITATFAFDAPGASGSLFSSANDAVYGVALIPGSVTDESGNPISVNDTNNSQFGAAPGTIATFSISDNAPIATINAPALTTPGASTYSFDVTYSLPPANPNLLDVRTIGTGDVHVIFPDGTQVIPDLVSTPPDPNVPTRTATATYRFSAPGGTWDSSDNGNYQILLTGPKVADTAANFVPPTQLTTTNGVVAPAVTDSITVDVPTVINLAPAATSIPENSPSPAVFTLTRTGDTSAPLTITYTVSGTATPGVDYDTLPGTLTFPAGAASASLSVQPHFDLAVEGNEIVSITVNSGTDTPDNASFAPGSTGAATLTIIDSPVPGLSVNDITVKEPPTSPANATFTVSLSQPSPQDVTFAYSTSAGTATAGADFTPASGQITIPAGQTSAQVSVPVLPDFINEPDETFFLNLTPVSNNVGILRGTGQATIQNQALRMIPFSAKTKASYIDARGQKVTVSLKGPGSGDVLVLAESRQPTDALGILLDGTTAKSAVSVSNHKPTTWRTIQLSAPLASLNAPHLVLAGKLTAASSVAKLKLSAVSSGSNLSFGAGPSPLAADLGSVTDASLSVAGALRSLKVSQWLDTDSTPDAVTAANIGSVTSANNFDADLLSSSDIGSVKVAARLNGSAIRATGSIHSVSVGAANSSLVFAGLSPSQTTFPTAASDFLNTASSIGSFTVRSRSGGAFASTQIAAFSLGKLDLGVINTANNGTPFGAAAITLASAKGSTPVQGPFNFKNPVSGTLVSEPDFLLRLL